MPAAPPHPTQRNSWLVLGGEGTCARSTGYRSPRLRPVKHVATPEFLERWRVATNVFERRTKSERRAVHHSPLNSNERKELLVGEVPTGEQRATPPPRDVVCKLSMKAFER